MGLCTLLLSDERFSINLWFPPSNLNLAPGSHFNILVFCYFLHMGFQELASFRPKGNAVDIFLTGLVLMIVENWTRERRILLRLVAGLTGFLTVWATWRCHH